MFWTRTMTDGFLSYSDCLLEAKYCLNANHELSTISAKFTVVRAVFSDKRTSQLNVIADVKRCIPNVDLSVPLGETVSWSHSVRPTHCTVPQLRWTTCEQKYLNAPTSEGDLERALDELTFYMFWTKDQIEKGKLTGDIGAVHGILVSPFKIDPDLITNFHDLTASYSAQYGIDSRRIQWVGYEITGQGSGTKLTFQSIE